MHPHGANSRRPSTGPSWATYRESIGDRSELFTALSEVWGPTSALYPGSYLDLSPSTAIPRVVYVDTDRRAARYFGDPELVASDLAGRTLPGAAVAVEFVNGDYTQPLPVPEAAFDLLISLYAGPFWDQCQRYLKPSGLFLANSSHGDASLAALDPRLDLVAAVIHRDGRYRLDRDDLARYLIPKKPAAANPGLIRQSGRGIAYTRAAFAYVFQSRRAPDPPSRTGRLEP